VEPQPAPANSTEAQHFRPIVVAAMDSFILFCSGVLARSAAGFAPGRLAVEKIPLMLRRKRQ
jgi:hypothetical protein